jgi:small subunit ribosomal protein S13
MAEQKQVPEKFKQEKKDYVSLVRIMQTDIPGNKKLLAGLTYVKGVSWTVSSAMCYLLKLNPDKKVSDLTKEEIEKISKFLTEPEKYLPKFLINRRNDFESGEDHHFIGTQLDMKKEFDIRRLKKIRSYRGLRHATGQPTRGQRTKSHFRAHGKKKAVGVQKKKPEPSKGAGPKK